MTKSELVIVFSKLSVAYPNFGANQSVEMLTEVWFEQLEQFPFELVDMAIKSMISTFKFIPTIAEVKETIYKQNTLQDYDFEELWKLIVRASNQGEYFLGGLDYKKAYNSLPRQARELIEPYDLDRIANSSYESVEYSKNQFRKVHEELKEKKKQDFLLSDKPLELIPHWQTKQKMIKENNK